MNIRWHIVYLVPLYFYGLLNYICVDSVKLRNNNSKRLEIYQNKRRFCHKNIKFEFINLITKYT